MTTRKLPTWHDDDEFWTTFGPWLFDEDRIARAAEELDGVLSLLELEPPADVLDLCCGVGRHSLELARRGFRVVGVDRTAAYLARAAESAENEGIEVELVREDAREFERAEAFDAAISLFTSFGYFDDDGNAQVLDRLHRSLRRGGRLIVDVKGREQLARDFRPRDWQRLADGSFFLQERQLVDGWRGIHNAWIVAGPAGVRTFEVGHRVFSGPELQDIVASRGFDEVQLFGSLGGGPYDHTATRLVVTARKR